MADETTAPTGSQPTQKEAFFFLNVISCMKNKPDVSPYHFILAFSTASSLSFQVLKLVGHFDFIAMIRRRLHLSQIYHTIYWPPVQVDWDKFAQITNYSNGACAQTRFRQIKKRLGYIENDSASSTSTTKPRAKKENTVGRVANNNASKIAKKSAAKPRGKKAKAAKVEHEVEDNIEDTKQEGAITSGEENGHEYGDMDDGHMDSEDLTEEGVQYFDMTEEFEAWIKPVCNALIPVSCQAVPPTL
jgi:hypothetical protein